MTEPIIEVKNIGKRYRIGANKEPYLSLRDEIVKWLSPKARRTRAEQSDFWALKDVSFSVQEGEAVGIIGRNGAGKSTLLKILSQITPPTEGIVTMRGRVASLLEVGTGFHPELTGRENIYLNGAILGMTRGEIKRKFDEIVAFAEIEKFLDTPVKRYSSGMYVRLAFAVAAHLEPEILVVDEVLAVGDAEFQKKCLGKMGEVAKGGRTVLFVSHNMAAISQLCQYTIVLKQGQLCYMGTTESAIEQYMGSSISQGGSARLSEDILTRPESNKAARFLKVQLTSGDGTIKDSFFIGESLTINIQVFFSAPFRGVRLSFIIKSRQGGNIYHCVTTDASFEPQDLNGRVTFAATFQKLKLYPGSYVIDGLWLATSESQTIENAQDILYFQVIEGGPNVFRSLAKHAAVVHEVPEWKVIKF